MNEEVPFDNILIDIFRVSNEKFTLDYVSIIKFTFFDFKFYIKKFCLKNCPFLIFKILVFIKI